MASAKRQHIREESLPEFRVDASLTKDRNWNGALLRQPIKLGSYCLRKTCDEILYDDSDSELRVLNLPSNQKQIRFDLSDGYIRLRDGGQILCPGLKEEPALKSLSMWILKNKHTFQLKSDVKTNCYLNTDFVTYRGCLTRIMTSPYENREDWLICATKFKGTIYMCLFMSDKKKEAEADRSDSLNLLCHGGYRFEEYITTPLDPKLPPKTDFTRNNEYNCVVRSRLGSHSLVYGAEMDCLAVKPTSDDAPHPHEFVEIKTTRTINNRKHWDDLCKFKMIKWWAQCYLIGIPTVVCGYRDNDMVVRDIQTLQVQEIPKTCKGFWKTDVCMSFLHSFLSYVKETVIEDDPTVVYEFYWHPGRNVSCRKSDNKKRPVLEDWYINSL
jgi:RAT1-interacting protein